MRNFMRNWRKQRSSMFHQPNPFHQPDTAKSEENRPAEIVNDQISTDLAQNEKVLKEMFSNCSDIVFREIIISHQRKGLIVFVDGIIDSTQLSLNALKPLLQQYTKTEASPDELEESGIYLTQLSRKDKYSEIIESIFSGNAALLVDGYAEALILNVIGGKRRGVEEPATEAAIRGPREGFSENLRTNTALLRFRIKSTKLKTEAFMIGEHTRTNVVLAYMEGIADPQVIEEARNRLKSIRIDAVLESGYIEELIEDDPHSPFPQLQYTERPDSVAAQILEGRFAIFVDGTPFVLTAPITLWQMLQASEDYYERFFIGTAIRWLRMVFVGIALFTPALYIAISTFHQDMLPTTLMLSVAASRESIPFPAIVEAMIMEVSFEALREAGVRLPKTVGQAVSILGALVIGQAAVQAGIVSAPMVIIVSVTGIASFTIPRFNFAISVRMLRFPLMFLAAAFGLYGIMIGIVLIVLHLCQLRSFGVPYLSGVAPYEPKEQKDIFIRAPWWRMILRPPSYSSLNRQRLKKGMKPTP